MAQTFLILAPHARPSGKIYRIVKDRSWDDMPWTYLVQTLKTNYEHGRNHTRWVYVGEKHSTVEAAHAALSKLGKRK